MNHVGVGAPGEQEINVETEILGWTRANTFCRRSLSIFGVSRTSGDDLALIKSLASGGFSLIDKVTGSHSQIWTLQLLKKTSDALHKFWD